MKAQLLPLLLFYDIVASGNILSMYALMAYHCCVQLTSFMLTLTLMLQLIFMLYN